MHVKTEIQSTKYFMDAFLVGFSYMFVTLSNACVSHGNAGFT